MAIEIEYLFSNTPFEIPVFFHEIRECVRRHGIHHNSTGEFDIEQRVAVIKGSIVEYNIGVAAAVYQSDAGMAPYRIKICSGAAGEQADAQAAAVCLRTSKKKYI